MINYIRDKTAITSRVLQIIDPDYNQETLETVLSEWWANIRKNGGLGLTSAGKLAFDEAELEYWEIPVKIGTVVKSSTKLALDRHIPCPWILIGGLGRKRIKFDLVLRLYDSRVASIVILYGGLEQYLDNCKKKV